MMSPYPDFVTISILLGLMQVANVKPYERDRENEPQSNANASLLCVSADSFSCLMTLSNAFSKVRGRLPARSQESTDPVGSARDLVRVRASGCAQTRT